MNERRRLYPWIGAVLMTAALAIGGCGGDGGDGVENTVADEPVEAAAPTKKEYIAAGDRICRKANPKGVRLLEGLNENLTALTSATTDEARSSATNGAARALAEVADVRDDVSSKLAALEAPEQGGADRYLRSRERNTKALRDQAKAHRAYGDSPSQETSDAITEAANESNRASEKDRKAAEAYGFEVCGQPVKLE